MSKKVKIIVSILGFLILVIGVAAGVYLVQKNQDIREKAAPNTSISFNPTTTSVVRGQSFTSKSKISTGTNLITGIDIELTYNPASIQLIEILPTSVLNNFTNSTTGAVIKNEIDNTTGNARFIAYTSDKTLAISGNLEILTIRGNVVASSSAGSYQVSYGPLTAMSAVNEAQNVAVNKLPLTINVTAPTASPTVSPSPTPTATPTRTATPTATSTPTQSATPSPTVYPNWDVNRDGLINMIDIGIVIDNYNSVSPTTTRADVNNNGTIDIVDIGIIVDHYQ